ncbi:MAG TPA: GDSL-type esterase/lipase family protein [Candidatus Paceibacterota bacterium]
MKTSISKIAEIIQLHYGKFFIVSFCVWMIAAVIFLFMFQNVSLWDVFIVLVSFFVICESGLRLLLYSAYGTYYKNSVFVYFLVDHPVYGNEFRKNCHAKKLNFLVFDKYVFPYKTGRVTDFNKNMELRNDFNVNSLGFRGAEFDPYNKKRKLRIFCSGGSTTAGTSTDDDKTWPYFLESCLKERGYDIEVINAGVVRWTSRQESLRFQNEISNYQPDITLLTQGLNDEFEFSCLFLMGKWKSQTVLNVEETRFYSGPHPILSSIPLISIFLAVQAFFREFYFTRNMSFTNPKRWKALARNDYIVAWFDNMIDIAKAAKEKESLVYNVSYPLLVDMADVWEDRNAYITGSRLTSLHADFQAISKGKISRTFNVMSNIVPVLKPDELMSDHRGTERISLFTDELHMTPKGNKIFAECLCEKLIADPAFQERYRKHDHVRESNVNLSYDMVKEAAETLKENSPFLDRLISEKIRMLEMKAGKRSKISEVPEDQYTTF